MVARGPTQPTSATWLAPMRFRPSAISHNGNTVANREHRCP